MGLATVHRAFSPRLDIAVAQQLASGTGRRRLVQEDGRHGEGRELTGQNR
jgi:hypothetical protein